MPASARAQSVSEFDAGYLAGVEAERAIMAKAEPVLTRGSISLYRDRLIVVINGKPIKLRVTSAKIFELLMTGQVVTKSQIIAKLWPLGCESEKVDELVRMHMYYLRHHAGMPVGLIESTWNVGWCLNSAMCALPQSETHPGGEVDISARDVGWRIGIANAWREIEHKQTAKECREAIAALGNAGPSAARW